MPAGLFFAVIFLYNGGARAECRSAILMEMQNGRVLYAQNADEELPVASTTKIMTALLAIERGNMRGKQFSIPFYPHHPALDHPGMTGWPPPGRSLAQRRRS